VIVRTLGDAERLEEALSSLARQSRRDFEVVVVDMSGGRVAGTLARLAPGLPSVQHLAARRRLSRPAALNLGIAAASAPLIGVLDEDNLYDPDHLERLVSGLAATGADYVYTGICHATYSPGGERLACRAVAIPFAFDRVLAQAGDLRHLPSSPANRASSPASRASRASTSRSGPCAAATSGSTGNTAVTIAASSPGSSVSSPPSTAGGTHRRGPVCSPARSPAGASSS
jgi:hypothetical protein